MQTLTDITSKEEARREKAWRYEKLRDERDRLLKSIARLEETSVNTAALGKIVELAEKVPAGLRTRGSRFVAAGFDVQFMLMDIAGGALADATAKQQALAKAVASSRKELAKIEILLKEFE